MYYTVESKIELESIRQQRENCSLDFSFLSSPESSCLLNSIVNFIPLSTYCWAEWYTTISWLNIQEETSGLQLIHFIRIQPRSVRRWVESANRPPVEDLKPSAAAEHKRQYEPPTNCIGRIWRVALTLRFLKVLKN